MNYYNEFDPKAAAWLRELIRQKHIPEGTVDERSITEVQPTDLVGFTQCHFFAGIGGWPLALRLAGVADDEPLWTGSCPCQPFSCAGKGLAQKDERHLWPDFFRLIRECRPVRVIGEQVESAVRHGWLDGVSADLEGEGYALGAIVLGAHSISAPHIRQRLFWLANSHGEQAHAADAREDFTPNLGSGVRNGSGRLVDPIGERGCCGPAGLEDAGNAGQPSETGRPDRQGFWDAFDLIPCRDGKARRIEPGTFPLAHGFPCRVDLLRGYGNAIVPAVAAEFIKACFEVAD